MHDVQDDRTAARSLLGSATTLTIKFEQVVHTYQQRGSTYRSALSLLWTWAPCLAPLRRPIT